MDLQEHANNKGHAHIARAIVLCLVISNKQNFKLISFLMDGSGSVDLAVDGAAVVAIVVVIVVVVYIVQGVVYCEKIGSGDRQENEVLKLSFTVLSPWGKSRAIFCSCSHAHNTNFRSTW